MKFKEEIIKSPPSNYVAYTYRFTILNLNPQMKYIGYHKGSVDDIYNHSSKNKEFAKVFSDSTYEKRFEVLGYGTKFEMMNMEHKELTKVDARNNVEYYNKTNAYPAFPEPDLEKVEALYDRIISGEFNVGKESIDIHEKMERLQPRAVNIYSEDQKIIRQKIDDAKGNTDNCTPVLVLEKRGPNGEDVRADGSHTVSAAVASKHCVDVPAARIPPEVHENYSEPELLLLGDIVNASPKIHKKYTDIDTAVKFIIDNFVDGSRHDSDNNIKCLKRMRFAGSRKSGQIKTILNKAKKQIDEEEELAKGRTRIDYRIFPHSETIKDVVEQYKDKKTCSLYLSSGKFAVDRVLKTLYAGQEIGKKDVMVVVWHSSKELEKAWVKTDRPFWQNLLDDLIDDKFTIDFHEMPSTMSDGTK
tara:strand:- start:78 stop:1322 length:1245 start_codon:yes stop_codon:yes gene_type:complete